MPLVVYEGPEDPRDTSSEFHVRAGEDRTMYRLRKGVAEEVPAELSKALTGGEYEGHRFSTTKNADDVPALDADADAEKAAELRRQEAEEATATGTDAAGGGGTTRATART